MWYYFDNIVGVTHPDNGQVEHVVIEGDGWAEYDLRTLPIHPLQQLESLGEKGCRVTMDLMINHELEREILFAFAVIVLLANLAGGYVESVSNEKVKR